MNFFTLATVLVESFFIVLLILTSLLMIIGSRVKIKRTRFWLPGRIKCSACHQWTRVFMGCFDHTADGARTSLFLDPECYETTFGIKAALNCYRDEWAKKGLNSNDAQ